MREYVIEPIPRTSIRVLRVTRTDGRTIRIAEGRSVEQKRDFLVFCQRFMDCVARQRTGIPDSAVRESGSLYDHPAMRALGWAMMVLAVMIVGMSFFFSDDGDSGTMMLRMVAVLMGVAPFIYRTVFADRPGPPPPPPLPTIRAGRGRKFSALNGERFSDLNEFSHPPAVGDSRDD
jgi:hypothetical protein